MKWRYATTVCFCLLFVSKAALARDALSFGYGSGTSDVKAYRANWQHAWSTINVTPNNRKLTGYWELAYTYVNANGTYPPPGNNNTQAVSAAAVLRVPYKILLQWYIDLGLGGAYFTNSVIANRNLGSNWVFEDRAGIGILCGAKKSFEIGYRFLHFSNAYLAQKNQSLNLHLLILGYWF